MAVLRYAFGVAVLLICVSILVDTFPGTGEQAAESTDLSAGAAVLGISILGWIVACIVYGWKLLRYGRARREFAAQLLVTEGIILFMAYLILGRTAHFDLSSEWVLSTLLLFGVPLIQFLDLVLPPWPRRQAA